MKNKILILTPVYKDWNNLNKLLKKINSIFLNEINTNFDLIVVDDFSNEKIKINKFKRSKVKRIKLIKLAKNLGSQRAIALGLKYIKNYYKKNYYVLIIDSDGQDKPSGILSMYKKISKGAHHSIVARRGQRKEVFWFRFFYEIYYNTIKILSFKKIRYGNFSFLNHKDVNLIVKDANLWNAYPPTLEKNLKNIDYITIDREKRISGNSKMNFFGLVYHALRVFSVLKIRIFFSSIFYLIIANFLLNETFLFKIIFVAFLIINLSNFILSLNSKKKFKDNFNKIKIITY